MINYLYWFSVAFLVFLCLYLLGIKAKKWSPALILAMAVSLVSFLSYYFYFEQIFVKRFGGVMTISNPSGHLHLGSTWKYDHLWVETFDPETNTCIFREFSRGKVLEGKVTIKDCYPAQFPDTSRVQPPITYTPE